MLTKRTMFSSPRVTLDQAPMRRSVQSGRAAASIIDHFNLPVSDLWASRRFYVRVLEPLGFRSLTQERGAVGFGVDTWAFGIVAAPRPIPKLHVAFRAKSRDAVDHFFQEATSAGAQPNGPPGVRSAYDPTYYAAFVIDRDGHNIEAVCRGVAAPATRSNIERLRER